MGNYHFLNCQVQRVLIKKNNISQAVGSQPAIFFDRKMCFNAEKMILTSEQSAKQLFAGQNSHHPTVL